MLTWRYLGKISTEDASRFTITVNGLSMYVTEVFIKEDLGIKYFGSLKLRATLFGVF